MKPLPVSTNAPVPMPPTIVTLVVPSGFGWARSCPATSGGGVTTEQPANAIAASGRVLSVTQADYAQRSGAHARCRTMPEGEKRRPAWFPVRGKP